ncbi:GGDEF domain-containing response regulator [Celerinatantimonas yamalensis]|uniref:diguanylate cyclase n=1 Tax=Celerinatantimonas yamalensis TaxID=559956 RepID=A0ABW9GD81_9GAMM
MLTSNAGRPDILIIDDDSAVIMALHKALSKIGRIRFASDAKQALLLIQEHCPNLILLDVELPDMNGLVLCPQLKADPDTADIPVIFITSHTEDGFEEKVFNAGACDYITKPLHPRVVLARTQTHLAHQHAEQLLDELVHTDKMTGLANRSDFIERLQVEFKQARQRQESLTVAVIDIDEFKKYNDQFGPLKGDECIKRIASALAECIQRPEDRLTRYGGATFALILPNTPAKDAEKLLQALLNSAEQLKITHAPNATRQFVTLSIGYSTLSHPQADSDFDNWWALVKVAEHALEESKQNGRNCHRYEMFETTLTTNE